MMRHIIFYASVAVLVVAIWIPVFAYAATYTATWDASDTATNYKLYGGDMGLTTMIGETHLLTLTGDVEITTTTAEFYVEACNTAGCTPSQHVFKQHVIVPPAATQLKGLTLDWSD